MHSLSYIYILTFLHVKSSVFSPSISSIHMSLVMCSSSSLPHSISTFWVSRGPPVHTLLPTSSGLTKQVAVWNVNFAGHSKGDASIGFNESVNTYNKITAAMLLFTSCFSAIFNFIYLSIKIKHIQVVTTLNFIISSIDNNLIIINSGECNHTHWLWSVLYLRRTPFP